MAGRKKKEDQSLSTVAELVKAVPVYEDMIQASAKEMGKNLHVVSKAVSVALAPLKALVWGYEKVEEFVTNRVSEKLKDVPKKKIKTPDPKIVGPAVEALRYTGDENDYDLREMYATLIANAMNEDKREMVHPAYVDIIRNLTADEALILNVFISGNPVPVMDIKKKMSTGGYINMYAMYSNLGHMAGLSWSKFDTVPKYLTNLIRLGLLDCPSDRRLLDENHYLKLKVKYNAPVELQKDIQYIYRYVELTPFGKDFIKTVVE